MLLTVKHPEVVIFNFFFGPHAAVRDGAQLPSALSAFSAVEISRVRRTTEIDQSA